MDDPAVERKGNMGVVVHKAVGRAFCPLNSNDQHQGSNPNYLPLLACWVAAYKGVAG